MLRGLYGESFADNRIRIIRRQVETPIAPDCLVCGGRAYVLVLQPARACGMCSGSGRALQRICLKCRGTGWMFVQKEGMEMLGG